MKAFHAHKNKDHPEQLQEYISVAAYYLWLENVRGEGAIDDWVNGERQIERDYEVATAPDDSWNVQHEGEAHQS